MTTKRANYQKFGSQAVNALIAMDNALAQSTLGHTVLDLVKIRASQINGCLFCLDAHVKEALLHGERPLRLHHLPLWRESALFNDREKAALEWTELMTALAHSETEEEDYENLEGPFDEKEIVDLTIAIATINAWNRLGVAFKPLPGSLDKVKGLDKLGLE